MKPLILTPGDPGGIGPEVSCRALVALQESELPPTVLLGDRQRLLSEARRWGLQAESLALADVEAFTTRSAVGIVEPVCDGEPLEVAAIRQAAVWGLENKSSALVTGPIHKASLVARGFEHRGHTDFLGDLCGVEQPVMVFVGGRLRVGLVTTHCALREVPERLTVARILHVIKACQQALQALGCERRRIGVCGLNPHAGEDGVLGHEEQELIAPAVREAQALGMDVIGPLCAESLFRKAAQQEVDFVVAMYHDQGLVPLKLVDFGRSVNWTLGLPIIRTSVDHGTAFDLAHKGVADFGSMQTAIELAVHLSSRRARA